MGVYYNLYAEANIDGRWYCLCPFFKDKAGSYKTGNLFWAQSVFQEVHYDLESKNTGFGLPDDLSDGLREIFYEDLDAEMNGGWGHRTWREYYNQYIYTVNFAKTIAPKVNKNKPFKYEGYILKNELAAFEVYEIEEFSEWLTEDEYQALSVKEKRQYVFHRWNDPYGEYWIYTDIYQRVRVLCDLFQTIMESYIRGSLSEGISDSQVRLLIYFG